MKHKAPLTLIHWGIICKKRDYTGFCEICKARVSQVNHSDSGWGYWNCNECGPWSEYYIDL